MPKKKFLSIIIGALLVMQLGFRSPVSEKEAAARVVERTMEPETYIDTSLSKEELYDKILGFLVGSVTSGAAGCWWSAVPRCSACRCSPTRSSTSWRC